MTKTRKKGGPLLVTRLQMAGIFGRDPRTIARWLEDGLPVAQPGRGGKAALFDVGACVRWVIQREIAAVLPGEGAELSPQQERGLLDRKRREDLELKLQVRRGELMPIEDVSRDFADCATTTKMRLRRIPNAVSDRVLAVSKKGPHAIKALLLVEIDEALKELSQKAEQLAGSESAA